MKKMSRNKHYPILHKASKGATWFFLLASIILLGYTFYRSEIVGGGWYGDRYFKYYLISVFGILFWGVVLWLRDEMRLNLVVIISSGVVGLYMVEVFLFVTAKDPKIVSAAQAGVHLDSRTKYEVYLDLIRKKVDAVPAVHPMLFVPTNGIPVSGAVSLFPFGGVSSKTTIMCNESGEYAMFPSDRYGFNNPDSVWDNKKVKWMLTGDSMTQGACVKPGDGIAGQIRKRTQQSVINLGSGGNGPLAELAVLEEYAKAREPEIVLWVYFEGNDLAGDLQFEIKSKFLMKYLREELSQDLINRQKEIDLNLMEYINEKALAQEQVEKTSYRVIGDLLGILRLLSLRVKIRFDNSAVDMGADLKSILGDILRKARDRVGQWGGKLYFVYLPANIRYAEGYRGQGSLYDRDEVLNLVRGLGISIIDIHEKVFSKYPDPNALFVFQNSHYNVIGYNLVANAIVDEIEKGL